MFVLGLTGSIGMGKSTTAQMFADAGCAVWDADAAVHRLYAKGGLAVPAMALKFPDAVKNAAVSRDALKQIIARDPATLKTIEAIVHPLVALDRKAFLAALETDIAVLDIPLLFETGGDKTVDAVACVIVPDRIQIERVMARGTMSETQLAAIREKQMPAEEKAARADYIIPTDTLEGARKQVDNIIKHIKKRLANA